MLSTPKVPPFPGHEVFKGEIFHTARWPQHEIDYTGKRVGVIGTGATGIQVIQTLASQVEELYVFQRTPQYAVRMNNYPVDADIMAEWRSRYPVLKDQVHHTFAGFEWHVPEAGWAPSLTKAERMAVLEDCWSDGSLKMFVGTYPEVLADPEMNAEVTEFVRAKIRAQIDDPEVADKLVPSDYGYGLYRVPLENGYFEAYNRSNVHLVNVKEHPIERFTENGLVVNGEEYPLDILVMATGFDAGTCTLANMNITGRDGVSLGELWGRDIRSALGLQVHGFPNLFTIAGPLAPSTAFCNMTLLMTVDSWYTGANIEGKQRRLLSYIGGVHTYRDICDEIKDNDYPGFTLA